MPHDIFLAHAGADTDRCRPRVAALRALGLTAFFDKDSIPLGSDWDLEIPKAPAASRVTVPRLSRAYGAALYERSEVHLALTCASAPQTWRGRRPAPTRARCHAPRPSSAPPPVGFTVPHPERPRRRAR